MPKETEFVDDRKDQMPSQVSERDLWSLLTFRLESSFPEGTSLDPVMKDICYSLFVNTRTQLNLNKIVVSKQS